MHEFMGDTLLLIYENPEIIGVSDEPDAYYENWQLNNSNPSLIKSMEKIESKFAGFIEMLIKVGQVGEIKDDVLIIPKDKWSISKTTKAKLELLGITCEQTKENSILSIEKYPYIFSAWKEYLNSDNLGDTKISRVITFIHGRYGKRKFRATDFFYNLVEETSILDKMEKYFEANHFIHENFDLDAKTRFAYVKWIKDYPKNETSYMRIHFNWRKKNQMIYEFRLPQFRLMLNYYEEMDDELQEFVFGRLKTCDNCGYCTQTDKSGKRPCLALDLTCGGEALRKCPLYPYLVWNDLNEKDMNQMIRLFEFSESKL